MDDPSLHFDLGVLLWDKGGDIQEKAAQHFLIAAKLNPQNGAAFRYLGHYYARVAVDSQRAVKCYQRAVNLNPDDSIAGVCRIFFAKLHFLTHNRITLIFLPLSIRKQYVIYWTEVEKRAWR